MELLDSYIDPRWPSSCLVTVDMQVDFAEGGAAAIAGTSSIVANLQALLRAYRSAGLPVVHLVRLYVPGSSDVDLLRRAQVEGGARIVAPGDSGSSLVPGLGPGPGGAGVSDQAVALDAELLLTGEPQILGAEEMVLYKPRWGGFYRTQLETWLRDRSVDTLVLAGCNLPNCPRATAFEASERDFRGVLVADAVSQASAERIADLQRIGVQVLSTSDVVAQLRGRTSVSGTRGLATA